MRGHGRKAGSARERERSKRNAGRGKAPCRGCFTCGYGRAVALRQSPKQIGQGECHKSKVLTQYPTLEKTTACLCHKLTSERTALEIAKGVRCAMVTLLHVSSE